MISMWLWASSWTCQYLHILSCEFWLVTLTGLLWEQSGLGHLTHIRQHQKEALNQYDSEYSLAWSPGFAGELGSNTNLSLSSYGDSG